jgi:hypothetical protein
VANLETKPLNVEKAVERVKALLAEAPVSMAQAVEAVSWQDRTVTLRFRSPDALLQTGIKDRVVECLLYQ